MFYLDNRRDAKDAFENYINLRLFYIPDSQGSIWQVPASLVAYMLDKEIKILMYQIMTHRNREINKMETKDRKDVLLEHIKQINKINLK